MRLVDRTGPGTISLNFMWLPTWIGMNAQLIKEIEEAVAGEIVGRVLTDDTLDLAGARVMHFLSARFPNLAGLEDYLDGMKFVSDSNGG